jgi:hypothetical protein
MRLQEAGAAKIPWRKWGPYLSERQWGTVREDYSQDGNAWGYFGHDQARSRAYHWGEDGLAGISDEKQLLCFSVALWNGNDPILKERLFGLTNSESNHGVHGGCNNCGYYHDDSSNWGSFAAGAAVGVATTAVVAAATRPPSTTVVVQAPAVGTVIPTLPGGCATVAASGAVIYHCSNVYYRPYYQGTQLVYQVVTYP